MSISLAHCITQKNRIFTCSPVLVQMHVHSTDLLSHCLTQESHLEFFVNSIAQRRLIHHLHFYSHDNAPNTLGFHTFTLCSSIGTSTQHIFFPTASHRRVIWSSSSQLSTQRRLIHRLHLCLITMHPAHGNSHVHLVLSHRHVQLRRSPFSLYYTGE